MLQTFIKPLIGAATSTGRMRALSRTFTRSGYGSAIWWVFIVSMVTILVILLIYYVMQKRERTTQLWKGFREHAERIGLSGEERSLLANIAVGAKLKDPNVIFTSDEAFYRGLNNITVSADRIGPFGGVKTSACISCRFYRSLTEKLGFESAAPAGTESNGIHMGHIEPGVTLTAQRPYPAAQLKVSVAKCDDDGGSLVIRTVRASEVRMGESWVLRYPDGGSLWEFSARVTAIDGESVSLKPVGDVRHIDRRRFVRTSVDAFAHVANFPFKSDDPPGEPPVFVPAKLVQLAGPGVLLEADLQAQVNDRVLVILELSDKSIEGTGVVRRADANADQPARIAIELVGLNTRQVAELARETNVLARETQRNPIARAGHTKSNRPTRRKSQLQHTEAG